jgi:acetyltransferase
MTIRNLDKLFNPQSIVLCGASDREGSVGLKMTENVLKSEFKGKVWLVNPNHHQVQNIPCFHERPRTCLEAPDLAIVAVPPQAVANTISQLGAKGTRAGIVLTAGLREQGLQQAMLDAAKPHCFRILGTQLPWFDVTSFTPERRIRSFTPSGR